MRSRAYEGTLAHARLGAERHRFQFPALGYVLDLDELSELERRLPWFGYNHVRPVALHDRDHLDAGPGSIRDKLLRLLVAHECADGVARLELITHPRWFHAVFNPVSFHLAWRADGSLRAVVAEVNNTFGERHVYVIDRLVEESGGWRSERVVPKVFHVSPFYDVSGEYLFRFSRPEDPLDITIELRREGRPAFVARLSGATRPIEPKHLAHALRHHALTPWLTVPRIAAEAARLRWRRGLRWHPRPVPTSPLTRRVAGPGPFERVAMGAVLAAFDRLQGARLAIRLPDGTERLLGAPAAAPIIRFQVTRYRFFTRLATHGDVGLGEAFTAGDFCCDDLTGLLERLALERRAIESGVGVLAAPARLARRIAHAARRNTKRGSRSNIRDHYDLGNDFFELFLDPSMTYSAARFDGPTDTLELAQERKLESAGTLAGLTPGKRVLEIGCGWGSFAIGAARRLGCDVTGLTLSHRQLALATQRARAAGVSDRARFELRDYRDMTGTFDAIVSIEMLEAVGHEYHGRFFATLDRLLAHGGKAVLQVITIADRRYDDYRRNPDWIQKHIFPGGVAPSLTRLLGSMTSHSSLVLERLESFGADYARTLREWRERLVERREEAVARGYDAEFLRTWEYYLAYCEAGFATRELNVSQMVLSRPEAG